MSGWWLAGLIGASSVLQSSVLSSLSVVGVHADLTLVIVSGIGISRGAVFGGGVGFVAGLWVDALEGRLIGLGALSLAAAGFLSGWMAQRLFRENALVSVAIVIGASFARSLLYLLGTHAFGVPVPLAQGIFRVAVPEAWLNGVLAALTLPGLFRLLNHVEARSLARRAGRAQS